MLPKYFWDRERAMREERKPISKPVDFKRRPIARDFAHKPLAEGLVVFHTLPKPPRIPYPAPIQVRDRPDFLQAEHKYWVQILKKQVELLRSMARLSMRAKDSQIRELMERNVGRELRRIEETWLKIKNLHIRLYEILRRRWTHG